jgi:diketogulonate reductase-like aldo/keto reductase
MERRELGRTGEKISAIGMGTWKMGGVRQDVRDHELKALRAGIELGLNLIDTAESYGDGKAEMLVGEAIRGIRDEVFIATKVSPHNFNYESVLKACESSVERLHVKFVDLYQLHWPNPLVPIKETMKAMEELVSRGRIRYIGVSNFSVDELTSARESLPRSEIVSNQVRYSISFRSVEADLLPFCEKEGITTIAYSPLDMGGVEHAEIPEELMKKYGLTRAQIMLNWVTRKDSVVAIPKAARIEHIRENADSLKVRLSSEDYATLSRPS